MTDNEGRPLSQCTICNSTFRRPEHLRRHLRSHTDDKPFVCPDCGKGFARSDTLHRHQLSHQASTGGAHSHSSTDRSFRACFRCATARVRCSGEPVCARCQSKGLECQYPNKRRKKSMTSNPQDREDLSLSEDDNPSPNANGDAGINLQHHRQQALPYSTNGSVGQHSMDQTSRGPGEMQANAFNSIMTPLQNLESLQRQSTQAQIATGASFTSNVQQRNNSNTFPLNDAVPSEWYGPGTQSMMTPHASATDSAFPQQVDGQTPGFNQDFFDQSLNWIPLSVFPSPYGPDMEEAFQYVFPPFTPQPDPPGPGLPSNASVIMSPPIHYSPRNFHQEQMGSVGNMNATSPRSTSTAQTPASAASESANSSKPDGSGSRDSAQRKRRKSSKSSKDPQFFRDWEQKRDPTRFAFPDIENANSRFPVRQHTELLDIESHQEIRGYFTQLCVETPPAFTPYETNHFPSQGMFNACIQLYFEHFHNGFPLVHKPTFKSSQIHWLVLLAVAAIGSNYASYAETADLCEAFQEFLRRATSLIAESYRTPELFIPIAQARLLNLVGLANSSTQQMRSHVPRYHVELARSCLEAGILQDNRSDRSVQINGYTSSGLNSTEHRWLKWIQQESRQRTGYLIWLIDCTMAYISNSRPLCTLDDARAPLPCSDHLWEARSADAWSNLQQGYPIQPSLCAAVETLYMKKSIGSTFSDLSHILLIHALYQKTWDTGKHLKQPLSDWVPTAKTRGFLSTPSKDTFWLPSYPLYENWRNSACDCLDVLHWHASSLVAKASGLEHTAVLHLHLARVILLAPFQEIHDLVSSLIGRYGKSTTATFFVHDGSYQTQNVAKLPQVRQITWRWLREDQHKARLAVIHAGSVFWHVRRYSTNSFYEPIAVYLASIVLFAYGAYKNLALASRGNSTNAKTTKTTNSVTATNPVDASRTATASSNASITHPSDIDPPHTIPPPTDTASSSAPLPPSDPNHTHTSPPPQPSSPSPSAYSSSSSADSHPTFIHLDRPCDSEIVTHFVRQGHAMSGNMSNVGDICAAPEKVLKEGAKLLKSRLMAWGVSREYYDVLMALSEAKRG